MSPVSQSPSAVESSTPPLRILFILPYMEAAGTERHTLALAQALAPAHSLALLSPDGPLLAEFRRLGVRHRSFPRLEKAGLRGLSTFRSQLRRMLEEHEPDLLHVHAAPELGLLARTVNRSIPLVITIHGFHGPRAESNYPLAAWVARLARARRVIAVSHADARLLGRGGLGPPRLQVIHNGIPEPQAEPLDWRQRLGLPPATPVIGAVGRLEEPKGFHVLLDAFAQLQTHAYPHPPHLVIVGQGSRMDALQRQAAHLGVADRVHFAGYMDDSYRAFGGFDVAVVPSLQDALPLVTLEAMAYGCPVVASSAGGLPEMVIDGETGRVCQPGDAAGLAKAVAQLLQNPDLAREMGRRGRQRFEQHFALAQMIDRTVALYREAVGA